MSHDVAKLLLVGAGCMALLWLWIYLIERRVRKLERWAGKQGG